MTPKRIAQARQTLAREYPSAQDRLDTRQTLDDCLAALDEAQQENERLRKQVEAYKALVGYRGQTG